ncbi:hypothetical protein D1871_11195 [Nakamurella silvestris]|nr:hypothetical protein D1871_11195 [Nakamurella silvestris]
MSDFQVTALVAPRPTQVSIGGQVPIPAAPVIKGETGDSAYQSAVAEGFVGTIGEWLASLKGPPGETPNLDLLATKVELARVQEQIPDPGTLATKAELMAVDGRIPSIDDLATRPELEQVRSSLAGYATISYTNTAITVASGADRDRANHTGTIDTSVISDFASKVMALINSLKGQPGGLATLDDSGFVSASNMSTLYLTSVREFPDIESMLAWDDAQEGDGGIIRSAEDPRYGVTYILGTGDHTDLDSWSPLPSPLGGVTTVNGRPGDVIGLAELTDLDAIWDALNVHLSDMANPHRTTKSQIGLGQVDNTPDSGKTVARAATAGASDTAGHASTAGYATTAGSAGTATTAGTANSATSAAAATTLIGLTATLAELNRLAGVTGGVQGQLDARAARADTFAFLLHGNDPNYPRPNWGYKGYIWIGTVKPALQVEPDRYWGPA